ncbi:MAG: SDR family oxidoreductase [Beijerinckiaceae bacterium]|nr:SDR family oxidoreductase [Beijerinckiaceae bacterium]
MSKGSILVLGGASDMGLAVAHRFAKEGFDVQLAARRPEELDRAKTDIEVRHHVAVTVHAFDALAFHAHEHFMQQLPKLPDVAVCVVGLLGEQRENETDLEAAVRVMRSNYEGPATILSVVANLFEARGAGTIVGVSSVAGDRGRATNYVYGSAKAGFTAFLSGLRNRLAKNGVHVVTVKPGFVATRMTEGMKLPPALTATPEAVADQIYAAVLKKRNVVYAKPVWRAVMGVIGAIPEGIFKKLKI